MRVLIVAPAWNNIRKPWNVVQNTLRRFSLSANLTISYLAGLTPSHIDVEIVDEAFEPVDFNIDADLVAITSKSVFIERAYEIADTFRERGVPVVMGGFHVSLVPEEASAHADAVVIGEAEDIWPRLLSDFEKGKMQRVYKGIPSDLKNLPLPRRDLLKPGYILSTLFATRSCPYECGFCSIRDLYGSEFRTRPVEEVVAELSTIKGNIFFIDDNMMADPAYSYRLFEAMVPLKKRWGTQASANFLEDEALLKMAIKAGFKSVFLGIESPSQNSLNSVNKSFYPVKRYAALVNNLNKHKISVMAGIVFGFDTDTVDIFEATRKFLDDIQIGSVTFKILTPYPNTSLFKKLDREGRILTKRWRYFDGHFLTFQPKRISISEFYDGYDYVFRSFYNTRSVLDRFMRFGYKQPDLFIAYSLGYGWDPDRVDYQKMRVELLQEIEEQTDEEESAAAVPRYAKL